MRDRGALGEPSVPDRLRGTKRLCRAGAACPTPGKLAPPRRTPGRRSGRLSKVGAKLRYHGLDSLGPQDFEQPVYAGAPAKIAGPVTTPADEVTPKYRIVGHPEQRFLGSGSVGQADQH